MRKKKPAKTKLIRLEQNGKTKNLPVAEALLWLTDLSKHNVAMALAKCRDIHNQHPQSEAIQSHYYQLLCDMELKQELLSTTEAKLKKQPRDKVALSFRAHVLRLSGRVEEAVPLLEKMLKLSPGDPATLNSLGTALKELGDFERALSCFDRAISIKPSYGKAFWNRSDIIDLSSDQLTQIEATVSKKGGSEEEKHYFHFIAYRGYEKLGEFDKAFEHLLNGNRLKRKTLQYSSENDLKIDRGIRALFTEDFIQERASLGNQAIAPIFIFGMPRSGTTLVEQILASHSQVKGGNELSSLGDATRAAQRKLGLNGNFPDWLASMSNQGWGLIGKGYQELTDNLRRNKDYLTDKALLSYKAVGLIKIALPNAKLIHVERNPMDLCFGCYRQLFNEGLKYSYDFEELAANYASHQYLMHHWDEVLPGFVLRLKYEELVADPKSQIEKLLAFCELDSEPDCFEPHKTERTVRTLSATQVRQPIFTSGVQRWKKYESHLALLKEALIAQGIEIPK